MLVEVAALAKAGRFDYLLIESTGISEPLPVAETFTFDLDEDENDEDDDEDENDDKDDEEGRSAGDAPSARRGVVVEFEEEAADATSSSSSDADAEGPVHGPGCGHAAAASLREVARLDSMVTVVDGVNFLKDLGSAASLAELGAQVHISHPATLSI